MGLCATGPSGRIRALSPRLLATNHDHDGGPYARSTNIKVINRRDTLHRPLTFCAWIRRSGGSS